MSRNTLLFTLMPLLKKLVNVALAAPLEIKLFIPVT